jgi:NADPH oxidase
VELSLRPIGPLLIYLIERLARLVRGNQNTILHRLVGHPSRVLGTLLVIYYYFIIIIIIIIIIYILIDFLFAELRMKKSNFKFEAAQYLFLNCPYISRNEWHPFTISSAPGMSPDVAVPFQFPNS